jgi:hypothetical protein
MRIAMVLSRTPYSFFCQFAEDAPHILHSGIAINADKISRNPAHVGTTAKSPSKICCVCAFILPRCLTG